MSKVGVFDSGVGGLSVANALQKAFPQHEIVFKHDSPAHFPYAKRVPEEIYGYVSPILQGLVEEGCEIVVIACNTVSATLIERLRKDFSVPLIAVEPMIEEAVHSTKTKVIGVCATPTTLQSARYNELRRMYASDTIVIEPPCADWSYLIEYNQLNASKIRDDIAPCLAAGADVIVLGCTHYHWIEEDIRHLAGKSVTVLQPESHIISEVGQFLKKINEVEITPVIFRS